MVELFDAVVADVAVRGARRPVYFAGGTEPDFDQKVLPDMPLSFLLVGDSALDVGVPGKVFEPLNFFDILGNDPRVLDHGHGHEEEREKTQRDNKYQKNWEVNGEEHNVDDGSSQGSQEAHYEIV